MYTITRSDTTDLLNAIQSLIPSRSDSGARAVS